MRLATLSHVNVFVRDIEALPDFYLGLFGLEEIAEQRSPYFRALRTGASVIGFNGPEAYSLLDLHDRSVTQGVKLFLTFDVEGASAVADFTGQAEALGARLIKPPYDTAYGSRQAVLADPEDNVFRINAPLAATAME
jgi:predicted enzyme related to lactoylglutathione lyase